MPRDGHTSVTVSDETFDTLQRHKPDRQTWDEFLTDAARMANPYPDGINEQLHAREQTRSQLAYINTRDTQPDEWGKLEVYWWPHGKQFLLLPHDEITERVEDDEAFVNTRLSDDSEGVSDE